MDAKQVFKKAFKLLFGRLNVPDSVEGLSLGLLLFLGKDMAKSL